MQFRVLNGDLAQLVGSRASVRLEVGNPGGFCFDTSSIPATDRRLLSMLATWSIGFGAIDAHWDLAEYERRQAEEPFRSVDFVPLGDVFRGQPSELEPGLHDECSAHWGRHSRTLVSPPTTRP